VESRGQAIVDIRCKHLVWVGVKECHPVVYLSQLYPLLLDYLHFIGMVVSLLLCVKDRPSVVHCIRRKTFGTSMFVSLRSSHLKKLMEDGYWKWRLWMCLLGSHSSPQTCAQALRAAMYLTSGHYIYQQGLSQLENSTSPLANVPSCPVANLPLTNTPEQIG